MENLNSDEFNLMEEEINAISALDKGLRFNNPPDVCPFLSLLDFWKRKTDHLMTVPQHAFHLRLKCERDSAAIVRRGLYKVNSN
jgi:hypothetical protein